MSDKRSRRHFTPQEKAEIVKRHLLEGIPVSDLCDLFQIHPTLFYQWQRQLFENAPAAFENGRKSRAIDYAKDKQIAYLGRKNVSLSKNKFSVENARLTPFREIAVE